MICCKIVTDYDEGKFSKLYKALSSYGGVLWTNDVLYVGSDEPKLTKNKVESLLKDSDYNEYFIKEYKSIADIKETESLAGWLFDWIIRINKAKFEQKQQKLLHKLSHGLDDLDAEVDEQIQKQEEEEIEEKTQMKEE